MPLIVFAVRHLLVLAILAGTAWACGRVALSLRRGPRADDEAPWPLSIALGLAMLAQAALLLALAGWFRLPVVIAIAILVNILAAGDWRRVALNAIRGRFGAASLGSILTILVVAAVVAPPFLLALYPPLGFDQTMYHLPFVRAFAATGGVPFLARLRFPVFPPLAELLGAAVLPFSDDVATQSVGWLAHAASLGLVFIWTRERSTAAGGWIAVAMLAGSPLVVYLAACGYVDPVVGFFGVASLYAAERASRSSAGSGTADNVLPARMRTSGMPEHGMPATGNVDIAWVAVAAFLAGSAAGVKYLGLYFVPAAAVMLLVRRRAATNESLLLSEPGTGEGGQRLRSPNAGASIGASSIAVDLRAYAWYAVVALVALAPTYGRLIALTGNPVFPFYPAIFGSSPWEAEEFLPRHGLDRAWTLVTFMFDATFRRHSVGGLPFLSPAFALGAPIALFAAWRRPRLRLRLLAVLAIGYLAFMPIGAHYFLVIAPLWCVLAGVAASSIAGTSRLAKRLLIAAAVIIALGGDAYTAYRVRLLGLPPATRDAREDLLDEQLPFYPAIAFLNRTAGATQVYAVYAENMTDYAAGTLLGDHIGPVSYTRVAQLAHELGSLAAVLDEMHVSYLLVPARPVYGLEVASWLKNADDDPRLSRIYKDPNAVLYRVLPDLVPQVAAR